MSRHSRGLLVFGTLAIVLGAGLIHAEVIGHYRFVTGPRLGWDCAFALVMVVTAYAAGLPDRVGSRIGSLLHAVPAVVTGAALMSLAQLVTGSLLLPRFVVAASGVGLVPTYMACARLSQREQSARSRRGRILVVADEEDVAMLRHDLATGAEHPASVVAAASPVEVRGRGSESQPLVELARRYDPTVLVLDRRAAVDDSVVGQAAILHEQGVRIRTLSLFYEEWMGKLPLGELERVSLMFDIGELHRARYGRMKRVFDVLVGSIGVATMVAVTPLVVAANLIGNRGPLFFRQERVGKGGRSFTMMKFRSCHCDEADGQERDSSWTLDDDPRVTPVGAWLRRLHIDELPNFINVLRGEMTLVGPRPEQPHYVEELSGKLPFYPLRHLVRPGLTGWAQVNFGYSCDDPGALQKLQYDFYYLRHQGLSIDLRVLGRSVRAVWSEGR